MGDSDLPAHRSTFSPAPSWDQTLDILDGFEQFMDATPNMPAASFAAQGFRSAPGVDTTADSSFHTPPQLSSREVTKRNNRIAQKRFRERRKVSQQISSVLPGHTDRTLLLVKRKEKKRKGKEKTTPFGVNLMRSQVLYRAAQEPCEKQPCI